MRVLVTGAGGQLGSDMMIALQKQQLEAFGRTRAELDITDVTAVEQCFQKIRPDAVIHCAAYTAVDLAEEQAAECNRINVDGTKHIVMACKKYHCKLMFLSTDYVFDGSGEQPWRVEDSCNPLSVYGRSKQLGEQLVAENLSDCFIIRTAWAFGQHGKNFVKTMLRLAQTMPVIQVVNDQIGSPTYTADLAELLAAMIQTEKYGIYHITNDGYCSWYEFACEIFQQAGIFVEVVPVTSEQYPSKVRRPKNSRLSLDKLEKQGFQRLPHWKDALKRYLELTN